MRIFCEAYNSVCVGPRALPPLSCVSSRCRAPASLCAAIPPSTMKPCEQLGTRIRLGALCVGPGAPCVGAQRTLCRGPALPVSGPSALSVLSVSGPRSLCVALCIGARRSLWSGPGALCVGARLLRHLGVHQPRAPPTSLSGVAGPQLRPAPHASGCGPPAPMRATPSSDPRASAGPQLRSACHPSSPARSLFPGENPKPCYLGEHTNSISEYFNQRAHSKRI